MRQIQPLAQWVFESYLAQYEAWVDDRARLHHGGGQDSHFEEYDRQTSAIGPLSGHAHH